MRQARATSHEAAGCRRRHGRRGAVGRRLPRDASGLGVLQLLADSGLLGNVRYSSSVSGGSVANGLFAHHYDELAAEGFSGEAFSRIVVEPCIERISGSSFTWKLLGNAWRIVGPKTRVDVLADSFADWFFGPQRLAETPPSAASSSTPRT